MFYIYIFNLYVTYDRFDTTNHLRISLIHSRFSQTNSRQICHSTCTLVLRCLKHMGMVQAVKNKVQPTKFYHITRHKLQEIQLLEVMQELREKLF